MDFMKNVSFPSPRGKSYVLVVFCLPGLVFVAFAAFDKNAIFTRGFMGGIVILGISIFSPALCFSIKSLDWIARDFSIGSLMISLLQIQLQNDSAPDVIRQFDPI